MRRVFYMIFLLTAFIFPAGGIFSFSQKKILPSHHKEWLAYKA